MRLISIIALVMVIMGHAFAADQIQTKLFERMAKIDQFVHDAPLFMKGKSLSELRKLGTLINERLDKSPSKYITDKIEEYITLQFDGLEIYGWVRSPEELAPIRITVTKSHWHILKGLDVGAPTEHILQTLDQPTKEMKNIFEYCGETECVRFYLAEGKISKVEFIYYAD